MDSHYISDVMLCEADGPTLHQRCHVMWSKWTHITSVTWCYVKPMDSHYISDVMLCEADGLTLRQWCYVKPMDSHYISDVMLCEADGLTLHQRCHVMWSGWTHMASVEGVEWVGSMRRAFTFTFMFTTVLWLWLRL